MPLGFEASDAASSQDPRDERRAESVPVLVSACLLGRTCRYDGRHNDDAALRRELAARGERAIPFCPEEAGGLDTPRPPAWIVGADADGVLDGRDKVVTDSGCDVTREFVEGAEGALAVCRTYGIERAYLKERSPSCGVRQTHVGDRLAAGPGVTARLLARYGVAVTGVEGRRADAQHAEGP